MPRNVVFIYLDSVRKDYFDQYAPRLAEMAEMSFEQCRAPSGWSLPSHASLLSGSLAHEHGISPKINQTFGALPLSETFLSQLPDHATFGVSGNTFASHAFEFDHYFDDFVTYSDNKLFQQGNQYADIIDTDVASSIRRYAAFIRSALGQPHATKTLANGLFTKLDTPRTRTLLSKLPRVSVTGGDAERISQTALRTSERTEEPYFAFMNIMDAHAPFTLQAHLVDGPHDAPADWHSNSLSVSARVTSEPFDKYEQDLKYYRDLYANSIDYLDRTLSTFVQELLETTDYETTVIVTSDHGEDLGYPDENYMVGHSSLSEAISHVPLIMINPPQPSPERVTAYFSHLDLGELLVGFANDRPVPDSVGEDRVVAEVLRAGGVKRSDDEDIPHLNRAVRSLWDGQTRVVWDSLGNCDEYTVDPTKPSKQDHITSLNSFPKAERDLFDRPIEAFDDVNAASVNVDDTTEERLRKLGYLD